MSRKNWIVLFLSLVLLTVSILVIYLLWNVKENKKTECIYENLTGEILNFPKYNDNDIAINHTKEFYDQNEEPRNLTIYYYEDYVITYSDDLDKDGFSYFTIKNKNNEVIQYDNKVKLSVDGVICSNGLYNNIKSLDVKPVISADRLYYVSVSNDCYLFKDGEKKPYFNYNYIDLNDKDFEVNTIKQMKLKIDNYYDCIK